MARVQGLGAPARQSPNFLIMTMDMHPGFVNPFWRYGPGEEEEVDREGLDLVAGESRASGGLSNFGRAFISSGRVFRSHLDHSSHCKKASGTKWSNR